MDQTNDFPTKPLNFSTAADNNGRMPATQLSSTNELSHALGWTQFSPTLVPGPVWTTFESFRTEANAALGSLPQHGVATLRIKAGTFRVLRDSDFQRLVGLAADVCRLKSGLRFFIQAAKVALKHPDEEHVQLLIQSASLIGESPELPEKEGHASFKLTPEELVQESSEDFDLNDIPRPEW